MQVVAQPSKKVHEVFSLVTNASNCDKQGFDTNFEGAAIHPKTKELWMTADNENFKNASGSRTPPKREESRRGVTPLIVFPIAKQ